MYVAAAFLRSLIRPAQTTLPDTAYPFAPLMQHLLFDVSVGSRTPQLIGCFYLQLIVLCYYYVHHVPIV
jgi:hypothetical protein